MRVKKKWNRAVGLAVALSSLACAAWSGTAAAEMRGAMPAQPTPFFVRYFDQVRPLHLEPGAIALRPIDFDAAVHNGWTPALAARLAQRGIAEDHPEMVGVGSFVRARLINPGPNQLARELSTRNAVAELSRDNTVLFASPVFIDERGFPLIITDEIIVGARPEADRAALAMAFNDSGLMIVERNFAGMDGVFLLRSTSRDGFEVLDKANTLAERADVWFSEPNAIVRGENFLIPNDPLFNQQWALNQANNIDMDAPQAWDISLGDASIITVILDVGVQFNHPDLNNAPGQDFAGSVPNGGPANSCDNHGTAVAGCISGIINNGIGIAGATPASKTASGKIGTAISFFGLCFGNFDSQPSMLANALNWSVTSGARITNSSFGYGSSATVTNAYASSRAAGVLHFAASGNGGSSSISYPASLPSVNAIGAIQQNGQMAGFSQFGTGQAFVAPGVSILTTDRTGGAGYEGGDYATVDGTSFASPYAAAVAAMILSINPNLTVVQVEQMMQQTSVDMGAPGYDTTFGWGRVNLFNAAQAAAATVSDPECGDQDAGSCCVANGSPFCNDASCCELICAADAFCCDTTWDAICAAQAIDECVQCFQCGSDGAGSCCESNGTPYCDDPVCCNTICNADPFCCSTSWDSLCAQQAFESANCPACVPPTGACCLPSFSCLVITLEQCGALSGVYQGNNTSCTSNPCPSGCGDPAAGSCCVANGTPYCDQPACCEAICAIDPFCCSTAWDQICADQANDQCVTCLECGSSAAGSCCQANDTPYCDDAGCCTTVCAFDPFCCTTAWDGFCATGAANACGTLCGPGCIADLNNDGFVDADDLGVLLGDFGCTGTCAADLDGNGSVDADDLGILLGDFGCGS